jgi:hypothetical protein
MKLERTMAGLEARLRPTGAGRFGGAAFLALWLVFWAVGEALALGILLWGGWALLTGQPPGAGRAPLETGPALATGVFLLVWVAFWSLGGWMAGHEFFRLIWSSDRILARGDGIELARRVAVFTARQWLPRDQLRRIYRLAAGPAVLAETAAGPVELTRNGTPAQQAALVAALTAELKLPPPDRLPPELPATWRVVAAPEGGEVLVKNPATRRTQARVAWIIALPLAWIALVVLREAWIQPNLGVVALMLATAAGFAVWGAARLTWTRHEWRLERGRVVQQRRAGGQVRERFTGTALRLTESTDSDGDTNFKLELRDDTGCDRALESSLHDPAEPRRLGEWLAWRAAVVFDDQATPEIKARRDAELAAWRAANSRLIREWFAGFFRRR